MFLTAQFAYAMALTMYLTGTVLAFANLSLQQRTSIGIFLVVLQSSFVVFGISASQAKDIYLLGYGYGGEVIRHCLSHLANVQGQYETDRDNANKNTLTWTNTIRYNDHH